MSTSVSARRGRAEGAPIPALTSDVEKIAHQYRDVDVLVKKAQRDAEQIKRAAERDKQEIEGRMRRRQSRLERRRQEALRREAEQRAVLEQKTRSKAEEVDKEAEQRVKEILKKAEEKAFELREILAEQDRKDRLNGRPKITSEWRDEVTTEFSQDTAFIRRVIMEGEVSRIERQNFIALFDEQQQWFDKTVKEVIFFFDEPYNVVMNKKNALSGLVDAQRQADEVVRDLVEQYHLSDQVQAQLRLLSMYEINNRLQSQPEGEVFLSVDTIRELVHAVGKSVAPGQREIKVVTEKQRIAELEARIADLEQQVVVASQEPVLPEMSVVPQEKADEKVRQVTNEAAQKVAALEQQLSQAYKAESKLEPRKMEKLVARTQGQIEEVIGAKEREVERVTRDLQAQMFKLQAKRAKAEQVLRTQSENKIVAAREKIADLQFQKGNAEERMSEQQAALEAERLKVHQLTAQLSAAQKDADVLKKDRDALAAKVSHKQQEKASLEAHLVQVQEHLELLTTKSHEQLVVLANQVAQRSINEEQIEKIMEKKAQERVELEIAVAQANEQLAYLHEASQHAIAAMAEQVTAQEARCQLLEKRLTAQQSEGAKLAQTLAKLEQAAVTTQSRHDSEREVLSERVVHLQRALAVLRSEQKAGREHESKLVQRAHALVAQAKREVSDFAGTLLQQQCHLDQRCDTYAQMQKVQNYLHAVRIARGEDAARDAEQMQALSQVAAFGEQVAGDYDQVTQAARDTQQVQTHLNRIAAQMTVEDDTLSESAMNDLEILLSLLGHDAQNVAAVPTASTEEVVSSMPVWEERCNKAHEEDDCEEEELHEPDEEPEMPEPVEEEGDDIEIDDDFVNRLLDEDDSMEDVFGGEEGAEEDEVPEPLEQQVVASTVVQDDDSSEEDEEEDEGDDSEGADEGGYAYQSREDGATKEGYAYEGDECEA